MACKEARPHCHPKPVRASKEIATNGSAFVATERKLASAGGPAALWNKPFEGFGPSRHAGGSEPARTEIALPRDRRSARRMIRRHCLAVPGVYGMIDCEGMLIYVGKSKSLRHRLLSYLAKAKHNPKGHRIIARTKRLVWEPAPHEFTALLRELELIRRFLPRYNVKGRPRRRNRAFLAIGRGPAPYAYFTATPGKRDESVFGPIPSGEFYRTAVKRLNDVFRLRTCTERVPIQFADQKALFAERPAARCLRAQFGTCLAPCAASCTRGEYHRRVAAARRFLAGRDLGPLRRVRATMAEAAAARRFEHAAVLRDAAEAMSSLHLQLKRLRRLRRRYSFVYPLPDYQHGQRWFLIERGQVIGSLAAPIDEPGRQNAQAAVTAAFSGTPPVGSDAEALEDADMLLLVMDWFRRYPAELKRTQSPDKVCVALAAETRQVG